MRHWNTILNYVFDHPAFEYRWANCDQLDELEYHVRAYLALNAVFFDTSIAVWGIKRHYDYVRPITAIRQMATLGQSSDPQGRSFHPLGLPLMLGHSRVLRPGDVCRANCGDYSDERLAYTPGPDYLLGLSMINQVSSICCCVRQRLNLSRLADSCQRVGARRHTSMVAFFVRRRSLHAVFWRRLAARRRVASVSSSVVCHAAVSGLRVRSLDVCSRGRRHVDAHHWCFESTRTFAQLLLRRRSVLSGRLGAFSGHSQRVSDH